MKPEIVNVLVDIALALSPALVSLLGYIGVKISQLLGAKVKREYLSGALQRLNSLVFTVVKDLAQTVAADLKATRQDGKLTADEKAVIKQHAVDALKAHLGKKGLAELLAVLGLSSDALDTFLGSKIEAAVFDMKKGEELFGPLA